MPIKNHCWLLVSSLLIFGYIRESRQMTIKSVNIPSMIKASDTDYIILDCDYDLEDTASRGLVVKWFYNTNRVVYQWIYGHNPLADEPVSKYVDLTYKASDNPYTEYRAIKLNKPGVDLTGEYTCVISTFEDERIESAPMIVYSTEEKFDLMYHKKIINDKDGAEITCLAEGLYPQPILNISVGYCKDYPNNETVKPTVTLRDDGLYDVISRTVLLDEDFPGATTIKCMLSIPKTTYNVSRRIIYYSGTRIATSTTTTKLHRKMGIEVLDKSKSDNVNGNFADYPSINLLLLTIQLAVFNVIY